MKIPRRIVETIDVKYVRFHAKLRDEGTYVLLDENKNEIKEHEGYVPKFFPYGNDGTENNFGDYIDLIIDLETGHIVNWIKPTAEAVASQFDLIENEG